MFQQLFLTVPGTYIYTFIYINIQLKIYITIYW